MPSMMYGAWGIIPILPAVTAEPFRYHAEVTALLPSIRRKIH